MSSPGEIISAFVAAAFVGVITLPFYAVYRWLGRRSEQKKREREEQRSAAYAAEFKQRETEFEQALKQQK